MATSSNYGVGDFLSEYGLHETLMPVTLILAVLSSAVHLGVIGAIQPQVFVDAIPSLSQDNAMLLFLGTLAITAISSETRSWDGYHDVEKGYVIFVAVGLVLNQYSAWFQNLAAGWGDGFVAGMFGLVTVLTIVIAR
jgi:hypothetical protein